MATETPFSKTWTAGRQGLGFTSEQDSARLPSMDRNTASSLHRSRHDIECFIQHRLAQDDRNKQDSQQRPAL